MFGFDDVVLVTPEFWNNSSFCSNIDEVMKSDKESNILQANVNIN